jgi:hypothetical protein
MIKIILSAALLLCFAYAFLQRRKSRTVSIGITLVSAIGLWFVIVPEHATLLAEALGVGRGADLVLYFWIVINIFVLMSLQFKIFGLQRDITVLTRHLALQSAAVPPATSAQGRGSTFPGATSGGSVG